MSSDLDLPCKPTNPETVELWCAHLPGDDVIPTVNKQAAEQIAEAVNGVLRDLASRSELSAKYGAPPTGHACAWPWDAASWKEDVVDFEGWKASDA